VLCQQFSKQYLKQYDTDDTGTHSHIELASMLDSLRFTLSVETVNSFTRNRKKQVEDELTVAEAIRCLEMQIGRPPNEKRVIVPTEEWVLFLDLSSLGIKCGENLY
jgi:phosphatidylserine decarboxylase